MKTLGIVAALLWLGGGACWSSDHVGDGEEPDPGPRPSSTEKTEDAPAPRTPVKNPPLKPISEYTPPAGATPLALPGPQGPVDPALKAAEPVALAPVPPVGPLDDLTADRAGTNTKPRGVFAVEFEDFEPKGLMSLSARKAYQALVDMKKQVEQMAEDLDAGGKERTRLIQTSEQLSKSITEVAELWPVDQDFKDICLTAKRRTLLLEEELRAEPRKWTHVRWAFAAVQKEVKTLRQRVAALAEGEPKPVRIKTKDGKEVIVEAPREERDLQREEDARRRKEVEAQRNELRKDQEGRKKGERGMSGD